LAVGPHQRVVTVEVGPVGQRVWLTLGVTAQGISSLHCATVAASPRDDIQKNPVLPTKDLT
jgi:flagellar biogenesis protein FliO